ncbi:MAG: hypothetical protein ACK4VI_04580 [Alphaproteobacteria bacterium]
MSKLNDPTTQQSSQNPSSPSTVRRNFATYGVPCASNGEAEALARLRAEGRLLKAHYGVPHINPEHSVK